MSTANQSFSSRRSAWARPPPPPRWPRPRRRVAAMEHHPEAAARRGRVEHDDALGLDAALDELVAGLLRGHHVPEMPAGGGSRRCRAGLEQRLVDAEEVADRGLRGRRQLRRAAEPLVEVVEVGDVGLARRRALEGDVERDLVDAVASTSVARHVVRRVRDDGDPRHRRERSLAPDGDHARHRRDRVRRLARRTRARRPAATTCARPCAKPRARGPRRPSRTRPWSATSPTGGRCGAP